jgi:hypothetical protein
MIALSIRQPWASMIVYGFKPVENRPRTSHYRGPLLIHASKTVDKTAMDWLWAHERELGLTRGWHLLPFRTGGIIGQAELYAVTNYLPNAKNSEWPADMRVRGRPWFNGPVGLWMRNASELPFLSWKGQLGLFHIPHTAFAEQPHA